MLASYIKELAARVLGELNFRLSLDNCVDVYHPSGDGAAVYPDLIKLREGSCVNQELSG